MGTDVVIGMLLAIGAPPLPFMGAQADKPVAAMASKASLMDFMSSS
jgi:hypothetical protein